MADSIVPDLHCDEVLLPDDELRLDETFLGEAGPGVYYKQTTLPRSTVVFPADEPQYCHAVLPAPRGNIEVGETSLCVDPDCEEHLLDEDAQSVPSMSHEDMTLIQQSSAAPHTTEVNEFNLPTVTVHAAVNHCMTPCHPQTPTEAFTQREPDPTLLTLLLKHQRSYLQMKESVSSNKSCNELESSSHWSSDLLFDDVCDCDAHLVPITRWDVEE